MPQSPRERTGTFPAFTRLCTAAVGALLTADSIERIPCNKQMGSVSAKQLAAPARSYTLGTLPLQAGPPTRWQHHTLARCQHLLQPHTHPGALSPPAEVSVQRPVPRQAAHAVNMPRRPPHAAPLKSSGARSAGGVERGHAHRPARFESCCRWAAAPASARPRSAAVCETPWALHTLEALSPRSEARWPRAAARPPPSRGVCSAPAAPRPSAAP